MMLMVPDLSVTSRMYRKLCDAKTTCIDATLSFCESFLCTIMVTVTAFLLCAYSRSVTGIIDEQTPRACVQPGGVGAVCHEQIVPHTWMAEGS